jgi:hypothetical protein
METYLTDAEQWELLIPTMGYMALLRNLRNFDQAGIAESVKDSVCARLQDPEEVARSRQFPYRFLSAYKAAPSLAWGRSLEKALDLSCQNVPELSGRSLVLIDTSGSMSSGVSDRSEIRLFEIGALFAAVLSKRCEKVDTVIFGDSSALFPVKPGESVLKYVNRVNKANGSVGHGTAIWQSVVENYTGHDRVVIFTDMQTMDSAGQPHSYSYGYSRYNTRTNYAKDVKQIPFIHGFNLAGYKVTTVPTGTGRFEYGGFTDASFTLMRELEQGGF